MIAALSNNYIHYKVGQRGLAFLGPVCRVIGFVPFAVHPPFAVLPCIFAIAGFGFGLCDSGFNAWVGNMQSANELLGILHGSYSLGAMISPLIATAMVVKADLPWYTFFYLMIAIVTLELSILLSAFWGATGAVYRQHLQYGTRTGNSADKARVTTREVLKGPLPWFFALFLFAYVGAEVSLGGWMVTFMLRVRNAERFLAGLTVTLFWMGLMLGRIILGFVTGRIGEKLAVAIYILLCLGLQLLYWLVPHFIASVVFVILLGFFLGPLFPAVIVVAAKLLPAEQHVSAIGFASAFAGGGAAVFPFAVGAAAQKHGVQVLQPFVAAMLVFILFVWLVLPGSMRKGGLETAKEKGTKPGADLARQVRGIMKKREIDN
jgi:fucose permease